MLLELIWPVQFALALHHTNPRDREKQVATAQESFGRIWLWLPKKALSSVSQDSVVIVPSFYRPQGIPCCISCVVMALLSPFLNCDIKVGLFQCRPAPSSLKSSTYVLMEFLPCQNWQMHCLPVQYHLNTVSKVLSASTEDTWEIIQNEVIGFDEWKCPFGSGVN